MSITFHRRQSAPSQLLNQDGTANSYCIQKLAVQKLSGEELLALEDDLEFFDRTGLVGIYMSRILEVLEQNKICTSATELAA